MSKAAFKTILIATMCLSSASAWTKSGFHFADDPQIPPAVKTAAASVFRIHSPLGPSFDLRSQKGKELSDNLRGLIATEERYIADFLKGQLDACERQPSRACTIYDRGSAFLSEEPTILWTALHNVDRIVLSSLAHVNLADGVSIEEFQEMKRVAIPIMLKDSNGRLVFGNQPGDYATVDYIDPIFNKGVGFGEQMNFMDYVRLRLSRPLAGYQPLQFELDTLKPGQNVYLAGFPRWTNDRASAGQPDSDGQSLRVSVGQVLDFNEAYRRWGVNFATRDLLQIKLSMDSELHFDADAVPGNSGGPVFTADGRVAAVFNSSTPKDDHRMSPMKSSFGVKANYLKNHTKIPIQ